MVVVLGRGLVGEVIVDGRAHVDVHDFGVHVHVDVHVHVHGDVLRMIVRLCVVAVVPSGIMSGSVVLEMMCVWIKQVVIMDMMGSLLCGFVTLY